MLFHSAHFLTHLKMVYFYSTGEVVSTPLPYTIGSIWPLPFGLLLQQHLEGNSIPSISFSSSSTLSNARSITRSKREAGCSPPINYPSTNAFDSIFREDGASFSSHFILMDPLEEPQACRMIYLLVAIFSNLYLLLYVFFELLDPSVLFLL